MLDLSIVIVNTNTSDLLRQCLQSVFDNTKDIEYEVIVVDNNSNDGSVDMITAQFPNVKLIQNDRNLGFSASNNRGFEISSGRYLLALNPDTVVVGNALASMVTFMDAHTEAGACGCKLLNADGSLQPSWENFPTVLSEIFYNTPLNKVFSHRKKRESSGVYDVDWVSGACLMVRRETMNEVGVFDERFSPIYSEETDWCYRIKANGWKIYYLPEPQVIHLWGQTTKRKPTWFFLQLQRNKYLFLRKHKGFIRAELYRCLRFGTCAAGFVMTLFQYVVRPAARDDSKSILERNYALLKLLLDPGVRIKSKLE